MPATKVKCPIPGCPNMINPSNHTCWDHVDWNACWAKRVFTQERKCRRCGQPFIINSSRHRYCNSCRTSICKVCGNQFLVPQGNDIVTCPDCRGQARKAPMLTCQWCGESFKQRGGHSTKYCGKECRYAASRKLSDTPNHNTWEYKSWRRQVFKRDQYICQHCGSTTSLQTHHIKSMANHPHLAYAPSNGITLCTTCHTAVHGGKPTNKNGVDRLECAICGNPITGRGKSPYCRSCAMRRSPKAMAYQKSRTRNSEGQFN